MELAVAVKGDRDMKKRHILLAALALVLLVTGSIGTAYAYFTTYVVTVGGYPVSLGSETEITESFYSWTKRVTITNEAGSEPVYVRARAYAGSVYELTYSDESGLWSPGSDGWWYYSAPVSGGESAGELQVHIGNVPEESSEGDSFSVVVVYETTPVLYTADGTPYGDWNVTLDRGES